MNSYQLLCVAQEGYYVVGTGNTGAAMALGVLGGGYLTTMLTSAFTMRRPDTGWPDVLLNGCVRLNVCERRVRVGKTCRSGWQFGCRHQGWSRTCSRQECEPPNGKATAGRICPDLVSYLLAYIPQDGMRAYRETLRSSRIHFALLQVMKTPQFWLLSTTFAGMATGGMGMFAVAKPMMSDVFSNALPGKLRICLNLGVAGQFYADARFGVATGLVTASFGSTYLLWM